MTARDAAIVRALRACDPVTRHRIEMYEDDFCTLCDGKRPERPWPDGFDPPAVVHEPDCPWLLANADDEPVPDRQVLVDLLTRSGIPHAIGPSADYPALPRGDVLVVPESREEFAVAFEFDERGVLRAVRGGQ